MIKPLFKKAIIIASMLLASLLGMANSSKGDDILISPKHNELPGGPHMPPAAVPFYAELESTYLTLGSTSAFGSVSVCLISDQGFNYQTVFDTSDGSIILPVGGEGNYVLTITTTAGAVFEGHFIKEV